MGVKVDYANKINVQDLDTVYITGGGFIRRAFKGISRDSAWGWEEPVWGGDLTRSRDFILTNIDTVDYGLVGRCEISYKYMNVKDYIDLMQISKQRVVTVDYFNRETGQRVTQEMAFTGNELGKLYAFGTEYLGNQDIRIKLVATNRELADIIKKEINVNYYANGGTIKEDGATISVKTKQVKYSDNITTLNAETTWTTGSDENIQQHTLIFEKNGYHLAYWATKDPTGNYNGYYNLNAPVTIWGDMNLYAIWEQN